MATREYMQEMTQRFVERYEQEVDDLPGFPPAERALLAARALQAAVNSDFRHIDTVDLMRVLAAVKDSGTAGYEMWTCGQQWIAQNVSAAANSPARR